MPPLRCVDGGKREWAVGRRRAYQEAVRCLVSSRPHACCRACAAPEGMRRGAHEPLLALHAGVHGGAAPWAGWRGWPRPRVRGAQPRAAIIWHGPCRYRIGVRLPNVRYLADLKGSAPQTPRKGTLTVPLDPSAGAVLGSSCGWGRMPPLRCVDGGKREWAVGRVWPRQNEMKRWRSPRTRG
jgi:hypothetical protein